MMRKWYLFTAMLLSAVTFMSAQILTPVKWKFDIKPITGNEYKLIYTANVDRGWTVYSQYTSDDGPVPTSINYESKAGIELIGKATESGAKKEGMDAYFGVNVIKFTAEKPFVMEQRIRVKDPSKPITGYVTFMACDAEKCLPPSDKDFSFTVPAAAVKPEQSGLTPPKDGILPNKNPDPTATTKIDTASLGIVDTAKTTINTAPIDTSTAVTNALGPKIVGNTIDQKISSIFDTFRKPMSNCGGQEEGDKGLIWTFILGFLGGIFALLTPCVFPMIPITVSFFTKDTKRKGWVNGAIYGVSIIVIYVALGLIITLLFGPEALNRLSTNWIANTLFFIIFVVFAFSFFGYFEITLPSSWTNSSDKMADKGGLIGIFFMAFTLALVSFSCTGPIIGSALVSAASKGEYLGPFLVMFGFSLALALPFGLFAAFPAWLNTLPKSGGWMQTVKVTLGFLELALAMKFLSTADLTSHWGALKYEIFIGIWIVIGISLATYIFGFIKFPLDSPLKKLSFPRVGFGVLVLSIIVYLFSGFMTNTKTAEYKSLSLFAGIAPPVSYNLFMPKGEVDPTIKSKYPSYTMCANNIPCFKDYFEGISYANEIKRPIMIDFTGHGCVNCRKTEQDIWIDDRIRGILKDSLVLISLYVDDDAKIDPVYKSAHTGTRIRNIGNKWADFQIVNFENNAQPLYVIATPDQKVVSLPRPYVSGISGYQDYLECSLAFLRNNK
jgi:thiol:disulfide interchange protein